MRMNTVSPAKLYCGANQFDFSNGLNAGLKLGKENIQVRVRAYFWCRMMVSADVIRLYGANFSGRPHHRQFKVLQSDLPLHKDDAFGMVGHGRNPRCRELVVPIQLRLTQTEKLVYI
jgi:hypothetical protein